MPKAEIASPDQIRNRILVVRGFRVMLDAELAQLYAVPTKRLNEQVRRNPRRFPSEFCFQLTREEVANLKSQNATSSLAHGGRRKLPFAFTEHGAIQAANVLNGAAAAGPNELREVKKTVYLNFEQIEAAWQEFNGRKS